MPRGGARPGAGRKSNNGGQELQDMLRKAFPEKDRKAVIESLVLQAELGNVKAAALLLSYTYGKPVDRREVTGEAGGPLKILVTYADDSIELA